MKLNIDKEVRDGMIIFSLKGRLTSDTASIFEHEINTISDVGEGVIIDCDGLKYAASAGLRLLLRFLKIVFAFRKPFKIINVNESVYEIFSITGFVDILDVSRKKSKVS